MKRVSVILDASEVFADELTDRAQQHETFLEIRDTPDIDSGEALLVAASQLLQDPSLVMTGDKRFIKSLKIHHPTIFEEVRHQLVSFEGCVLKACETDGIASVVNRLRAADSCDSVIKIALGSDPAVDEQSFHNAFASYDPLRSN